ncbi:MAG TPA: deoxyguanosinetriphosphate triphosphohydrolase [Myxococcales bacterium]|nr:deoxyguanosinetriphosphate triphosphohydrolase [Myxococcales bacterium]HIK86101.1 deoxyguanosinetriphosphate triphosphohydrolase [Myxococcales bacterium]
MAWQWRTREGFEEEERKSLAPWAACSGDSAGRLVSEPPHAYRSAFQRDRDRIVHARAFRRLEFKTQVFVHIENDHYRNRLTHTIEGAQIARTIARALRLCEDLAEAIVLAHDLGHTPFGHAGEAVLSKCMQDDGGFDHNRQSLRIVDLLEDRYPDWNGLNLTSETREGILKHGCHWPHPVELPPIYAQRSLEAQVADSADEIAYLHHDLDDGLRSGVLSIESVDEMSLWKTAQQRRRPISEGTSPDVVRAQTIAALGDTLIGDLIAETSRRLDLDPPGSLAELRSRPDSLVGFSTEIDLSKRELKSFLSQNFYHHPHVLRRTRKAEWIVGDLFRTYLDDPTLLPSNVRARFGREGLPRAISDYIAGMTDRFAMDEHKRLLDPHAPS